MKMVIRDKTLQKYEMQNRVYIGLFYFEYFMLALKHKGNQKKEERKNNIFLVNFRLFI